MSCSDILSNISNILSNILNVLPKSLHSVYIVIMILGMIAGRSGVYGEGEHRVGCMWTVDLGEELICGRNWWTCRVDKRGEEMTAGSTERRRAWESMYKANSGNDGFERKRVKRNWFESVKIERSLVLTNKNPFFFKRYAH